VQLAPPNPPPITTTRGPAAWAISGAGNAAAAALAAAAAVRNCRRWMRAPGMSGSAVGAGGRPPACSEKEKAAAPEGRRFVVAYTSSMPWFFSGIERMRLPVALKNALSTAGAATQIVGSPTPPHGPSPPDWMMIDSTFGIWPIRIEL